MDSLQYALWRNIAIDTVSATLLIVGWAVYGSVLCAWLGALGLLVCEISVRSEKKED